MDAVLKLEYIQKFYGKEANLTKAIKNGRNVSCYFYFYRLKRFFCGHTKWGFRALYRRKTVKNEWISDNVRKGLVAGSFPILFYRHIH